MFGKTSQPQKRCDAILNFQNSEIKSDVIRTKGTLKRAHACNDNFQKEFRQANVVVLRNGHGSGRTRPRRFVGKQNSTDGIHFRRVGMQSTISPSPLATINAAPNARAVTWCSLLMDGPLLEPGGGGGGGGGPDDGGGGGGGGCGTDRWTAGGGGGGGAGGSSVGDGVKETEAGRCAVFVVGGDGFDTMMDVVFFALSGTGAAAAAAATGTDLLLTCNGPWVAI